MHSGQWLDLGREQEETALSPSVKTLLCFFGVGVWVDDQESRQKPDLSNNVFLGDNGLFNIEECFKCLELNEDVQHASTNFPRAAFKLSSVFKECENMWTLISLEEFSNQYKQYFEWTGNSQLFHDCFEMLKQRHDNTDILSLLLLCTGIEHALRNIYALENVQCPMLLKDILLSKEIKKHLGEAAIQILQILLGPPVSMNLRNVAWHGFLSEGELPTRYTYFLLTLTASISSRLTSKNVNNVDTVHPRRYFSLFKVDSIARSFPDLSDDLSINHVKECVMNSWMAGEKNKDLFQDVFRLHHDKKYGFSCVQGFPILEHALRRRFVKVNNCEHRLLTAEATTLYTTFEEILDCYLPDGKENKLIEDLGEPFMDLLHDLLIYPSGPRTRDRLGHGEADVYSTPSSLSVVVIVCLGYLAGKDKEDVAGFQTLMTCVDGYESKFHPVTELKEKIQTLSLNCTHILGCLRIDPDLKSWSLTSEPDIFIKNNSTFHEIKNSVIDLLCVIEEKCLHLCNFPDMKSRLMTPFGSVHNSIQDALRRRVSTLHRWQKKEKCPKSNVSESEIIGLMHRIVLEMLTVLDQIEVALQQRQEALDSRLLRSRQRDNMKRLILLVPSIVLAANYQSIIWTWLFHSLDQTNIDQTKCFKRIQKFLKSMLQIVENLRTLTSQDNNKWTKAEEILLTFIQTGLEFTKQFD